MLQRAYVPYKKFCLRTRITNPKYEPVPHWLPAPCKKTRPRDRIVLRYTIFYIYIYIYIVGFKSYILLVLIVKKALWTSMWSGNPRSTFQNYQVITHCCCLRSMMRFGVASHTETKWLFSAIETRHKIDCCLQLWTTWGDWRARKFEQFCWIRNEMRCSRNLCQLVAVSRHSSRNTMTLLDTIEVNKRNVKLLKSLSSWHNDSSTLPSSATH